MRNLAKFCDRSRCQSFRPRSDDRRTKRLPAALLVDGKSADMPVDGTTTADASPLPLSVNLAVDCWDLIGNSALDHPRLRSSNARADSGEMLSTGRASMSDAMSRNSISVPFEMSKLGEFPLTKDISTAAAKSTSGFSQEPR